MGKGGGIETARGNIPWPTKRGNDFRRAAEGDVEMKSWIDIYDLEVMFSLVILFTYLSVLGFIFLL